MDATTYKDANVIQLAGRFVPLKLDAEKEGQEAAKKHGVTGYPTILFLDADEKVVGKIVGYLPAKDFGSRMQQVLDMRDNMPKWEQAYKSDPKNLDSIVNLGKAYAMQENDLEAMQMAEAAAKIDPKNTDDKLSDLYLAVGDMFQISDRPFIGIEYFNRVARTSKDPAKLAYARMSMGYCYFAAGLPHMALEQAELGLQIAGIGEEDKKIMEGLKTSAQKVVEAQAKEKKAG